MPIVFGTFICSSRNILGLSYYLVLEVIIDYECVRVKLSVFPEKRDRKSALHPVSPPLESMPATEIAVAIGEIYIC